MSNQIREEYLRWNPDGSQEHVITTRSKRDLGAEILKRIGDKVTRRTPNVFGVDNGRGATIYASERELYVAIFLSELPIRAHWQKNGFGIFTPVFLAAPNQTLGSDTYLQFEGKWAVPASMRLMFAARIKNYNTPKPYTYADQGCYLYAWDNDGRCWVLPLPNIFEPGNVCMGQFDGGGATIKDAFQKACNQIEKSNWNSDLNNPVKIEKCNRLFRFKMDEEGAVSLPVEGDWRHNCFKVGTAITEILNPF